MANPFLNVLSAVAEHKAIPDHPALHGVDPISTYSPGASRSDAVISQREAPLHAQSYGGGQAIDWVMDCVRLYADTASDAMWHLEKPDGTKLVERKRGDASDAQVGPADLYALLKSPNPFMDYQELIDLLVIDLLLVGNAYWFKDQMGADGKPLAIYRLAPSYLKIVPGPYGPKRFEYQPPGARTPLKLSRDQVVHYRLPNPHSAYYGLGLIQGGGRIFDMELALTDTQASYYENKADPSLIVQSERRVPRDVFNKLRAQLRNRVSGPGRAGELLVLEAGLKAETLSPNARDALFDTISKLSRDRIFAMFRVSAMLLGMLDAAAGSNKVSDARREFDNKTMRPFLNKLQNRITAGLMEPWDVQFRIDYNYTIPQEELIKQGGELAKLPGVKVKEIRRFLVQGGIIEEESTGDKDVDEEILNMPTPEIGPNGMSVDPVTGKPVRADAVGADRPLPGEPGRPPNGANTRSFGGAPTGRTRRPGAKSLDEMWAEIDARMAVAKAGQKAVTLKPDEPFKLVGDRRPQDRLADRRDSDVDAAVATIDRKLRDGIHLLERGLMDHAEGKAVSSNNLVKKIRQSTAWPAFENALWDAIESGVVQAISTASVHQGTLGREADLDYEALARRISHREEGGVPTIVANLKRETLKIVEDAVAEGKTAEEIQSLIGHKMQTWRDGHIQTVALTEATHGYNAGTLEVGRAVGVSRVLVEDGHDHDAECAAADGSVWTIDHADKHRIEHPRCRRAFTLLDE